MEIDDIHMILTECYAVTVDRNFLVFCVIGFHEKENVDFVGTVASRPLSLLPVPLENIQTNFFITMNTFSIQVGHGTSCSERIAFIHGAIYLFK